MKKYLKYWKNFVYIIEHKWNVAIECFKMGLYIHAFTHDISKFLPSEFIPYAKFFHSENPTRVNKQEFQRAWLIHQKRNRHHWNYWVNVDGKDEITPLPMPKKYVKQMIADWKGMSRKFGDTAQEYYMKNKNNMILHYDTMRIIDWLLFLDDIQNNPKFDEWLSED